ncbi:MAG: hypothetical protein CMO01_22715 [Thalassobius sp.]|nr:hypothetical protein [Thalassovita sp.]
MKKQITLDIPKPCGEKWSTFTPTATGGFCASCQKNVIDFTKMTDDEIQQFFLNKPRHACGRFHPSQLKTYSTISISKNKFGWKLLKAGFISLSLLFLSKKESFAQRKTQIEVVEKYNQDDIHQSGDSLRLITVKGIVISEYDKEPLPGVSILIKGTLNGTNSNIDGDYELNGVRAGDVLIFSYIGFMHKEVKIPKEDFIAELNITLKMEYDLMGELAVNEFYTEKSLFGKLGDKFKNIFN